MSEHSTRPTDDLLVAALWRLVAERGWDGVTMARLAAAAGAGLADLRERVPTKLDLLRLHARTVDRAVLAGTVPHAMAGGEGTPRDRVFDAVMRRLDALQPHRAGILRLMADLRRDPLLALSLGGTLAPLVLNGMAWLLEAASLESGGAAGVARAAGLGGVWLATLRAWVDDEGADLGLTMAALDRALDRAEQVARSLRLDAGDATLGDREAQVANAAAAFTPDVYPADPLDGLPGAGADAPSKPGPG